MSKKISKIFTYLLLTVLAVVGLGNVVNVSAEDGEDPGPFTDVIITKLESSDDLKDMDLEHLAGGVSLDTWFDDAEPLAGISFSWYAVNDTQLVTLKANPGNYDTPAKMADAGYALGGEVGPTNAAGRVTIPKLAEGNYWIVENGKSIIDDSKSKAVPFGLTLPFTNLTRDGWLDEIYVYPKNTLQDVPVAPEKEVDKNKINNAIGELHTWKITQAIPLGIADYERFGFIDEIDSRLDFEGVDLEGVDSVIVEAPGVTFADGDYEIVYTPAAEGTNGELIDYTISGTLTVYFSAAGRANLANATDSLTIKFDTRINDTAIMGEPIVNNVVLDYDNGHGDDGKNEPVVPPFVYTGGYKFQKLDGEAGLAGAEFIISREITDDEGKKYTEYVQVVRDDDGAITKVNFIANKDGATKFVSADPTGLFEVRGLPYGHYTLTEVKAPEGYALPTSPDTPFEVTKDSYKVVQQEIQNKKITIPQTGGMGTAIFTVIGVALMTISVVSYKRTSEA